MKNQGMETGNPGFAGPAGFQGRQLGAIILAVMVLDTQTPPCVAAASCLDFPRLTKETGMILPSHRSYIGCCYRYLYNLPVPGLPIQCTIVSQLAARLCFSKYCLNGWARELQGTSLQSNSACDYISSAQARRVPSWYQSQAHATTEHGTAPTLHIQEQSRPPYCQHSSDPIHRNASSDWLRSHQLGASMELAWHWPQLLPQAYKPTLSPYPSCRFSWFCWCCAPDAAPKGLQNECFPGSPVIRICIWSGRRGNWIPMSRSRDEWGSLEIRGLLLIYLPVMGDVVQGAFSVHIWSEQEHSR